MTYSAQYYVINKKTGSIWHHTSLTCGNKNRIYEINLMITINYDLCYKIYDSIFNNKAFYAKIFQAQYKIAKLWLRSYIVSVAQCGKILRSYGTPPWFTFSLKTIE